MRTLNYNTIHTQAFVVDIMQLRTKRHSSLDRASMQNMHECQFNTKSTLEREKMALGKQMDDDKD